MKVLIEFISIFIVLAIIPTTILFIYGFIVSLGMTIFDSFDYLKMTVALLLPGYSLYALWWLVFKFGIVTFKNIPKHIWLGLVIGIFTSCILIILNFTNSNFSNIDFKIILLFLVSPLLATTLCFYQIWYKMKNQIK